MKTAQLIVRTSRVKFAWIPQCLGMPFCFVRFLIASEQMKSRDCEFLCVFIANR